jgi:Ser/Thr protein kinase RdoA (MazF antagonist)
VKSPADLESILTDLLSVYFGRTCAITALRHHPYIYSTSFALEDLEVELADGTDLRLILKNLGASGLLQAARASKPTFLHEPLREIQTYQRILEPARLGTATCYGAVTDEAAGRHWLLLEKVPGRELYQVGDLDVWLQVAGWLASMHSCAALRVDSVEQRNPHLLSYDWAYYRRWLDRAKSFRRYGGRRDQEALKVVGERLSGALERLASVPLTFLHGEFYASNILVEEGPGGRRICPVDWEMAGIGPGLLDLAALCTGWAEEHQRVVALAYYRGLGPGAAWLPEEQEFLSLLRCCQLCLAVQWLGWAPDWVAPAEHARDWLLEASRLTEGISS